MANPFEKRATEYLADTEAFLAVVTPEPLITFFKRHARSGSLYDRLTIVTGTPGSGKTTLARLFEYSTVNTLLRNPRAATYRSLADALNQCGVLENLVPRVLGARVPLESEYREFWEFPYAGDVKMSLTARLLESRSVIRWLRQLNSAGIPLTEVEIVPRAGAEAALEQIGGRRGDAVLAKARQIERAVYRIVRALVPPQLQSLGESISTPYRPFDVIEAIRFPWDGADISVTPLAIFDDAHSLHPIQYERLQRWLAAREMKIGRWILTRLDALQPAHVLGREDEPDVQRLRVLTEIRMQQPADRSARPAFRKMAKDMSSRYLHQMDAFNRRGLTDLGDLLLTGAPTLSVKKLATLTARVDAVQRRVGASDSRRRDLERQVETYFRASTTNIATPELMLAATAIALERYGKRTPQPTLDLFAVEEPEPSKPITIDASVIDGARIHLLHEWNLPYYVGFDALCDASTENAEQFLQLAARLVAQAETQLIRGRQAAITPLEQDRIIRRRAAELINAWDFPHHKEVRRLTDEIARQCLMRSLEGNAPLGGGANAWGIPAEQFAALPGEHPRLARILQFAIAYNAVQLKPDHATKGRMWCLLELGGPVAVHHGLTLRRGGFCEREVADLAASVEGDGDA